MPNLKCAKLSKPLEIISIFEHSEMMGDIQKNGMLVSNEK